MNITAMTYNIRLGIETNLDAVAAGIRAEGVPDLVALQEVGHHWNMGACIDQAGYLADALGLPHCEFAGALEDDTGGWYGIAVLSRWPLVNSTRIKHPKIKDEDRVILAARIDAPIPFDLITSHFSIYQEERRLQAELTAKLAAEQDGPTLILGDFNARPESDEYQILSAVADDAFHKMGRGSAFTFSVKEPHRQIDYILYRGGFKLSGPTRVLRQVTASDHFPLVTTLTL